MAGQTDIGSMRINGQRLWDSHIEFAKIGGTPKGGICRLALTSLDGQARDLFIKYAEAVGCTIRVDQIGNIFARRPGTNNSLDPVMTGSHMDTQPTGGKFDGNYGVLSGLEILRTLHENNIKTEAPIEVVVWTNEEGSRFVPIMMGSGVYTGVLPLEKILSHTDADNITVAQALEEISYAGSHPAKFEGAKAYFEAHIEQGPILEANEKIIGVVTGALGQRWYNVLVTGQESHAGTTPMELRKDALLCSTEIIQLVNQLALERSPNARGTVGWLNVYPNSRNVIPGQVQFSIEFRALTEQDLGAMEGAVKVRINELQTKYNVQIKLEEVTQIKPQPFADSQINAVRSNAEKLGLPHMDIVSGAGHDAVYMARVTPTGMIFVPCKDGISHNELEDAKPQDLEDGCNVLLHAMLDCAVVV